MSETATTPATEQKPAEFVPVPQFDTNRNEVDWTIVQDLIKRGENKGNPYLRPSDINVSNFDVAVKWLGVQMVIDILNAKLATMGNLITDQATSDVDGKLDIEKAKKYFTEFSTRGETIAELEEKKDKVGIEMRDVSVNMSLSNEEKLAKIGELGQQYARLVEAIESKSRERKPKQAAASAPAS